MCLHLCALAPDCMQHRAYTHRALGRASSGLQLPFACAPLPSLYSCLPASPPRTGSQSLPASASRAVFLPVSVSYRPRTASFLRMRSSGPRCIWPPYARPCRRLEGARLQVVVEQSHPDRGLACFMDVTVDSCECDPQVLALSGLLIQHHAGGSEALRLFIREELRPGASLRLASLCHTMPARRREASSC